MEQGRGNVQSEQNGTAVREPARNAALPSYFCHRWRTFFALRRTAGSIKF